MGRKAATRTIQDALTLIKKPSNPSFVVSDISKKRNSMVCPRCKATMDEVVRIAPLQDDPGLIGYECPSCRYVTSVFWHGPTEPKSPSPR
jgi:transposase-like protein